MNLAFIGFGHLGKQILHLCREAKLNIEGVHVFDDTIDKQLPPEFHKHAFEAFDNVEIPECQYLVALGYKHLPRKIEIIQRLKDGGKLLLTLVHPSSHVSSNACLEEGVIVYPMCNIDMDVKIGSGTILNNSVTVSHDCEIGKAVFLAPGAVLCGKVKVGDCSFIGANSTIVNNLTIGSQCIIGAASCVTSNLDDKTQAIGNPCKIVKHISIL